MVVLMVGLREHLMASWWADKTVVRLGFLRADSTAIYLVAVKVVVWEPY